MTYSFVECSQINDCLTRKLVSPKLLSRSKSSLSDHKYAELDDKNRLMNEHEFDDVVNDCEGL